MKQLKILLLSLCFFVGIDSTAQLSKITDAGGTVLANKAQTYYAKVFKRKNGANIEYIWYSVDVNGNKLYRGGRIKGTGTYSTLAAAEAALPLAYSVTTGGGGATGGGGTGTDLAEVVQYQKGLAGDVNYQVDAEGSLWHNPYNHNTWSQMSVSFVPSTNKILLNINLSGWGSGAGTLLFKLEMSPTWYTKAEIEAMDFSLHKGKDISIIGALFDGGGLIQDSKQSIVHIAGDNTADVPSWFKRTANNRIGSPSYFPNFSLNGKINILNYGSLDNNFNYENHQYLTKGYNIVTEKGNPAVPKSKAMLSEYDTWATGSGCPPYVPGGSQVAACLWLETTPMYLLMQYYQPVINEGHQYGSIFHDFEAFGYEILNHQVACNRLASLHRAFKQANPNCLMTSYINAKPVNIVYDNTISYSNMVAENAKYSAAFSTISEGFFKKAVNYVDLNSGVPLTGTGSTGYMSDNLGLAIVGDYAHRYNDSQIYSFIQEMELAKKFVTIPIVSLHWSYIETLPGQDASDINSVRRYYVKSNGFPYFIDYKPAVPFSEKYNRALWSNFICEGQWDWHDPNNAVNGYDYHGYNAKDVRGDDPALFPSPLPSFFPYIRDNAANQFVPNKYLGMMETSTTIGYDYGQLALWQLSLNNDIITQTTTSPEFSTNGGSSYYSGEDLKPASAEYLNLPVVRMKKHPTQNTWLVIAMNKHLEHNQTQTIRVKVNGSNTVDLKINGQFSTLMRVQ